MMTGMISEIFLQVPFIGGELAGNVGFPNIMRFLGFMNFVYAPILLYVTMRHNLNVSFSLFFKLFLFYL